MKLIQRLRKCCPKCNKLSISRIKSTKKYKCWSCKAEFENPAARVIQHRQIALRRVNEENSVIPLRGKLLPFPDD